MPLTIENAPDELRYNGNDGRLLSDDELQDAINDILGFEAQEGDE